VKASQRHNGNAAEGSRVDRKRLAVAKPHESVGYGRAYFVADAKWQALIRCERRSGICIISYCVPAY
jgi:hypothetical protein